MSALSRDPLFLQNKTCRMRCKIEFTLYSKMQDFRDDWSGKPSKILSAFPRLSRKLQTFLDGIKPFQTPRWIAAIALFVLFLMRIISLQGWYIVMYALFVHYLRLFIAFLRPSIWKHLQAVVEFKGPLLPTRANEEFRPFIRQLPELKIWCSVVNSTLLAIFLTFFEFCDVPMYWQICVLYYTFVVLISKKHEIMNVIKYKYLPFAYGKHQKHDHKQGSKGD